MPAQRVPIRCQEKTTMPKQLEASRIVIILFALTTAAIHFSRAVVDPAIRVLFILNGLGYLFLVGMLYLPLRQLNNRHRLVRQTLMGYTAVTILLYFVWGVMSAEWVLPLGPVDKLIEVALFGLLWREDRRSSM